MNPFDSPNPVTQRPCILLVDDTPANIDLLVGLLRADYNLKVANRGGKALQVCESTDRIDLILLDVMMPEMDGFEVCRLLRASASTRDIPVVFLTAKADIDGVVQGLELGGNDYVTKPFRPAELLARVRTQLTLRAQQRRIAEQNAELQEMLHVLCHDVANHFSVLSLTMELARYCSDRPLESFLPQMEAAVRNGINLTALIREMRRSQTKELRLGPVPLRDAMDEALLLLGERLRAKRLAITTDLPAVDVLAERCSLVNSVLCNILTNAIKFSFEGTRIEVGARAVNGILSLHIRDHGIGMPPAVLEDLFDIGQSRTRLGTAGERGTGFGMPIMKRLVGQFGGSVSVSSRDQESHPDSHGTEFRIDLKIALS